jgi:hypothetical protein
MRLLTDQQRLFMVESEQIYQAWRDAVWRHEDYKYGLQWKHIYNREYLVRGNSAGGSRSLGVRSEKTEEIFDRFQEGKELAKAKYQGLKSRIETQTRLNRAVRLGRLPTIISEILLKLDLVRALADFRVVGTHALFAYEAMGAVEFKIELLASGDVDLLLDIRKQMSIVARKLDGEGLLSLLKKVDKTFEIKTNQEFRAINKDGFIVDLISQDKGMKTPRPQAFAQDDLQSIEVPNLEWLANSPRIEQVVIAANGSPILMPVPDPRAFALHKAWLSKQLDREPVKKQRDFNQAVMVVELLKEYLPNYPLDSKMMKYFPKSVWEKSFDALHGNNS